MAKASGIRAGRAYVEVFADIRELERGMRRAQNLLKAFAASMRTIGRDLITAGATLAAPLAISTKVFADFEQQMARVRALTNATQSQFEALSNEAQRLGAQTIYSASQAAEAMSVFALAGLDVDKILKSIGPTLDLAAAGQLGIAQAADIAIKIMYGLGIEADRLGDSIDVLAKAFTTANTDLLMLGDAFKFVGPIASIAGISLEELIAAIQMLSNAGIQAEMAGTTLRGAILSLTSPSKEAASIMQQLGVRVADSEGNMRSLIEIISDFERGMQGMGSAEQLEVLGKVFDARQAAGMSKLIEQGSNQLHELTKMLEGAGGTAARIASVQLNTLRGSVIITLSALEGLGIAIGESLVGPLRIASRFVTSYIERAIAWVKANRTIVAGIALVSAALTGAGTSLIAFGISAKILAFAIGGLAGAFGVMAKVAGAITAALGVLVSPIGAIVTAIGILVGAVLHASGVFGAAADWITTRFTSLRDFFHKVLGGISDALVSGDIELAARVMWAGLKVAWLNGIKLLQEEWNNFRFIFEKVGIEAFSGLKKAWIVVVHWFESTFPELSAGIAKAFINAVATIKTVWSAAVNWLSDRFLEVMGMMDPALDVEEAKRLGQQQLTADITRIERERLAGVMEADRRASRSEEEREREKNAALAEAERSRLAAHAALAEEHAKSITDATNELEQARKEFAAARIEAQRRRESSGPSKEGTDSLQQMLDRLNEALGGVADTARDIEVRGTFNPRVLAQLFGSSPAAERTARATEQTAQNTRRILTVVRSSSGMTFA